MSDVPSTAGREHPHFVRDAGRHRIRRQRSKPIAEPLRQWLTRQAGQVPDSSATAKAIEYSLGRWAALTRYLEDGNLPSHLYLKDILERLPTQLATRIDELLPHRWESTQ
jgi:hypothetical protein